jgi:hypothetical protein
MAVRRNRSMRQPAPWHPVTATNMSVRSRLRRLERDHAPRRPRVRLVALDHPPDGRTRAFLDDGAELPQGADWRPFAVEGTCTVIGGVDIDVVVGHKQANAELGAGGRDVHTSAPAGGAHFRCGLSSDAHSA